MSVTFELIKLIGTPFLENSSTVDDKILENIYDRAFADRVAFLYLTIHRRYGWPTPLEEKYKRLKERRERTLDVVADLGNDLNQFCREGYAIFKSLKPYPAAPNDTDVMCFGDGEQFKDALDYLYSKGYLFHEWAPMQTTLIHPKGKGKTGKGKKGGTYYIDMYSDISTDYFLYIDKRSLLPYVETRSVNGQEIQNVCKEVELAIILFHNVFPERTFQLEHFYMPLYHMKEDNFDLDVMIEFVENQKLTRAVASNLTFVEYIHGEIFGFVPDRIVKMLDHWGRNQGELERFKESGAETPYMFSPALQSLYVQGLHMLNPVFFFDVVRSLKNRFSEKGIYHLE